MKKILLSITVLCAVGFASAVSTASQEVATTTHKTFAQLVKEGKTGVTAAIAAYEKEANNEKNPKRAIIKKDVETLRKIAATTSALAAKKEAANLSKETKDATDAMYKNLGALAKLSVANDWRNNCNKA